MKKYFKPVALALTITIFFASCGEECNDCLELSTKSIKYIDSEGVNLVFGEQAVYDPANVVIQSEAGEAFPVWQNAEDETLEFNLEPGIGTCFSVLQATHIDTLDFELAERKSSMCCGNVSYSTKTSLNGQDIRNDDLIVIRR